MKISFGIAPSNLVVSEAKVAAEILRDNLRDNDHEELWTLYVNSANVAMEKHLVCMGSLDACIIDVRSIIKNALLCNANGIIIAHNHPSGNVNPGTADIKETERLKKACDIFEIRFLDHLVIGVDKFFSFAEEAAIGF